MNGSSSRPVGVFLATIFFGMILCSVYVINSDAEFPVQLVKYLQPVQPEQGITSERHGYFDKYMHMNTQEKAPSFGEEVDFDKLMKMYEQAKGIEQPNEPSKANIVQPNEKPKGLPVVYFDKDMEGLEDTMRAKDTKIPRIIHQTWKTHEVPKRFNEYVQTWLQQNPGWQYWFWTDAQAEQFVRMKYPKYLDMYKKYPQPIHRADAMRYFILHEFGGWYADLDIVDLKPLDDLGKTHNCIISQEPWGHVLFIWHRLRLACNALMAARPKHPYFKYVIEQLPKNAPKKNSGPMATTGPIMIDNTLKQYESKTKTFKQDETVYLANPDYFLPTMSGNGLPAVKNACKNKQKDPLKKRICDRLDKENWSNQPPPESYTNHVWIHTYYHKDMGQKTNTSVFELVPLTVNVSMVLQNLDKKPTMP